MSTRNCPDCDGPNLSSFFSSGGDGRCKRCHGTGEIYGIPEAITEIMTFGTVDADCTCEICSGTGQCQTCGGTGEVNLDDDEEDNDKDDDEGN
ncbi:MAG: hypothetical protein Q8S04_01300 [Bacteroidales bacterium]|nr:hypothetical protein [Bacteroidales bacterium]